MRQVEIKEKTINFRWYRRDTILHSDEHDGGAFSEIIRGGERLQQLCIMEDGSECWLDVPTMADLV